MIAVLALLTLSQIEGVFALGGVVSGDVTCGGTAVNNALVSLIVDDEVEATDYTDATGFYRVMYRDILMEDIPATIKVEKSGYTTIYRDTTLQKDSPTPLDIEWEVTQTCNGYVYDHVGDALSSATVKLIRISDSSVLDSDTTDANGYYSFSEDVQENLYCKIQAEKTGYETHYLTIYCDEVTTSVTFRIADTSADKIAVFFYATNAITYDYISIYGEQLEEEEGFDTIIYHENTSSWRLDMVNLDSIENSDDFVFIHIMTHGNYNETSDDSYCVMEEGDNPELMYSSDFATYLSYLESENIFVLVGACHSGGFVDDVQDSNRFVISTTEQDKVAYSYSSNVPNDEPCFEHYFFYRLSCGDSGTSAYDSAKSSTIQFYEDNIEPYPWPIDKGPQCPLIDNQLAYTWFEWW